MEKFSAILTVLFLYSTAWAQILTCGEVFSSVKPAEIYILEKASRIEEHSIREKNIASHIYMDTTEQPYLFAAFPEGNSGVGVWFSTNQSTSPLTATSQARVISQIHGLHGVEIEIKSGSNYLKIEDSVLGSMRFVRDRELNLELPPEVKDERIVLKNGFLQFSRRSLNGLAEYQMNLIPLGDTVIVPFGKGYEFRSPTEIRFKFQALNSEKTLTPLSPADLFKPEVLKTIPSEKLQAFSFLLYKEKMMAGSPRYFSKFGRDSIYTLRALMDKMKPEAVESLLNSSISSIHPQKGLVSHEQHEGDFASYVRLKEGKKVRGINTPLEDYKMIDDDFAFVFVFGQYAKMYPQRVAAFLKGTDQRGLSRYDLLSKLFDYVDSVTFKFRDEPVYRNLVSLYEGEPTGQWRDSVNGLGGGRYPFDVNAAFVPAALRSLAELYSMPETPFYNLNRAAAFKSSYDVWSTQVVRLFEVRIPFEQAQRMAHQYLENLHIQNREASPAAGQDFVFPALALDQAGRPIRIMHSDDSLMMTFGYPSIEYLRGVSQRIDTHFPFGLRTSAGLLIANPVFETPTLQKKFDETKYHGRVSWKMQEDLMVYGIDRQLQRTDLPQDVRRALLGSRQIVEDVLLGKEKWGGTEVFSITNKNGQWVAEPFGGDAKSNSNQLWSHLRMTSQSAPTK